MEFEVELHSAEELALFFERDASVGGMFIPTDLDLRVRSTLKVFLVHPEDGSTFELDARVSHVECDLDAPGVGVEFIGFSEAKRAALKSFVYGAEVEAPAPAPRAVEGIWDFDPQPAPPALEVPPAEDDALARLFEPWSGAETQRLWSTPPDEEFNHLFDALDENEASGLRRSRAPSALPAAEEEAPDFRLSMPSWTKLEASPGPVVPVIPVDDVVDLSDDASLDLVEATPLPQNVDGWARRHAAR
ncbi:MAG: PilZ domain-containing protein [Polyangiales bacterium]